MSPSGQLGGLDRQIVEARDNLFEEELFHELLREARVMTSQGVTTRENLIQIPVGDEHEEVLLDLEEVGPARQPEERTTPVATAEDTLAEAVAHTVRILLTYAHRQNLRRRTQLPPPFSLKRKPAPEYQLMRPVLAYLQHRSHSRWMEAFLQDIQRTLAAAGLECRVTARPFVSAHDISLKASGSSSSSSTAEHLLERFLRPLESNFSCSLVTPHSTLDVRVRTSMFIPPLGTSYDLTFRMPEYPDIQPPARIGLRDEAASAVLHLILLDVVSAVSTGRQSSRTEATTGSSLHADAEEQRSQAAAISWRAAYPHRGELLGESSVAGPRMKMQLVVSRGELGVHVYLVPERSQMGGALVSRTWKAGESGAQGLLQLVSELSVFEGSMNGA